MKDKGYTLTELLAVIVILGVILLIAIPSISKLKSETTKNRIKKDAEVFITMAKQYIELNPTNATNRTVNLSNINKSSLNGDDYISGSVTASECSLDGIIYKCNTYSVSLETAEYEAKTNPDTNIIEVNRR